jgi:endo-1,4-beta-xylanase
MDKSTRPGFNHLNDLSWGRRDFLKSTGLGLASVMAGGLARPGRGASAEGVSAEVDARIERLRKTDKLLKLICPPGVRLKAGQQVRLDQVRHKFLFGSNIFKLGRCQSDRDNETYARRFSDLMNFATLPFYWWDYERERGKPNDRRTDSIVQWCKQKNIMTKGHPLAWNYVDPPWIPHDPQQVLKLQFERIKRCINRFQGDIDIWDVVNEATHYDRAQCLARAPQLSGAMRSMGVGSYIRAAFSHARQANSDATLIINDYRTDQAYIDKVLSELLDQRKTPLYDVIGIQSHMHGGCWGADKAWDVCERYAQFGKPLHFTELTVVSGPRDAEQWKSTAAGEKRQAQEVCEFYKLLFSHPAVEAITWWDLTDQGAWQGAPAGFLRDDMTPKPAYEQLLDLIKGQWWTRERIGVDGQQQVRLRGFLGQYQASVQTGKGVLKGTFTLDRPSKEVLEVRLS